MAEGKHLCPVWVGYLLANPLRTLLQDPRKLLAGHVHEGARAVDIGCAMGFFSIPLARLAGPGGQVVCVDVQAPMLGRVRRKARRAGVNDRVETRLCEPESLGLDDLAGTMDFALAFAVVHEAPNPDRVFADVFAALKAGGRLLLAEPRGHVSAREFSEMLSTAGECGFASAGKPHVWLCHAELLKKQG